MNKIIEKLYTIIPHYCHALEVETAEELASIVENAIENFVREGFSNEDIKDFITTLSIYALDDEFEDEVYDVNLNELVEELL